jgi:CYTH domain-containing protein
VEQGINIETENPLTKAEYQVALLERDTDHTTIEKMRYHLHHSGLLWELDMFEDKLEGLCVLELEVAHKDDLTGEIETPPYLNVEREITNESGWSNYELSLVSNLDDAETNHISKSSWFDGLVQRASSLWNAVADAVFEEHDV